MSEFVKKVLTKVFDKKRKEVFYTRLKSPTNIRCFKHNFKA
jgi:hypothetical protein